MIENELEQKINLIIERSIDVFRDYIDARKNKIVQIPKLAFLSLYKESTIFETRSLGEIYSRGLIKLISSWSFRGRSSYAIYLDCNKFKFVFYNGQEVPEIDLLTSFLTYRDRFDLDAQFNRLEKKTREELSGDVFSITKSKRVKDQETAYNYILFLLDKNIRSKFDLTYEDVKLHIGKNKILNEFLQSEEDFQKIKNEGIIKSATKLLKQ